MGKHSDFKLPKFEIPDFKSKAKETVEKMVSTSLPDFAAIADEKLSKIKNQIENPDLTTINNFIDANGTTNNISKIAKSVGIDIPEEQINSLLQKKNDFEAAAQNKAFSSVESFMSKQGYPIKKPEVEDIASKLSAGEDMAGIAKDMAKPFLNLGKDLMNGNTSISINSEGSISSAKKKLKEKAEELLKASEEKDILQKIEENQTMVTEKLSGIKIPDAPAISLSSFESLKIDSKIPPEMQKIIDNFNFNGGN